MYDRNRIESRACQSAQFSNARITKGLNRTLLAKKRSDWPNLRGKILGLGSYGVSGRLLLWAASLLALPLSSNAQHQSDSFSLPHVGGTLPYSVEIKEVSFAPAAIPNIHSIAAAEWEGQWVIIAGRTNGLHGMTGRNPFDPAYENQEIWVIDPRTKSSWRKSLEDSTAAGLSQSQVDSLSAVNTEFYQDGSRLIVVGGYGFSRSAGTYVTYDTLSLIDLPGIVAWIKAPTGQENSLAADHIEQIHSNYFQVTGGGLERIGSEYQLVFGQDYQGSYRPMFDGAYTKQIRRFQLDLSNGLQSPVSTRIATTPEDAFRRRDVNILTILDRKGVGEFEEKTLVLSGVFTPEVGVWTAPVIVSEGGIVAMDDPDLPGTLNQGFQIYHCSKASLFNRATDESHVLLFGGLTVLERDLVSGDFIQDDQVPFTNQCSVVVRDSQGRLSQYWLPTRFPEIQLAGKELRFGTNAEFFLADDVPKLHPKVIDLAEIREPTVIGHIFGGLFADAGNNGNTGSSGRIFAVTLIPSIEIAKLQLDVEQSIELSWTAALGKGSVIEESDNLADWKELLPPTANQVSLTVEPTKEPRFFRRISSPESQSNE